MLTTNQNKLLISDKWLWAGVIFGACGFLLSLLWPKIYDNLQSSAQLPIAIINGVEIKRDNVVRQIKALADDKRNPITTKDTQYVLQRIIEEELLVQRGIEVRLASTDRQTRGTIVNSMISMITADAKSYQPSEKELRSFYKKNAELFSKNSRIKVQKWDLENDNKTIDLEAIKLQITQGKNINLLLGSHGKIDRYFPNTLLPPMKLSEYLGPSITEQLMTAPGGYITMFHNADKTRSIIYVEENQGRQFPPFEEVIKQVEFEFISRKEDEALREYLDWLKQRADIKMLTDITIKD